MTYPIQSNGTLASPARVVSPQTYARLGGLLYLLIIALGIFGEVVVRAKLIVPGDSLATAHRILASEFLFRCGLAGDVVMHLCDLPLMVILYVLLRPVSRDLSLLAAIFSFLQTAVLVANKINLVAVLLVLRLHTFTPDQRADLASLSLNLHEHGFGIGLIFFGVSCLLLGYLLFRSGYFPRTLGVLQAIAGICYLINSFALLLFPTFAEKLVPTILLPAFLGELLTALWLLIMGVNAQKWNDRLQRGPLLEPPVAG